MKPLPRKVERVVLGGGMTGLSVGWITGSPVISNSTFDIPSPFFLQANDETEKFVSEAMAIGTKTSIQTVGRRTVGIGFASRGQMVIPNSYHLGQYADKKSRSNYRPEAFEYLTVNTRRLMSKISSSVEVIDDTIISVDPDRHILTGKNGKYKYEKLISTVPAPAFARMVGTKSDQFESIKIRAETIDYVPYSNNLMNLYDYTYFVDDSPLLRYTPTSKSQGVIEYLSNDYNQVSIVSGKPTKYVDIEFAGRFARWEEEWSLHDDISKWWNYV